MWTKTPPTREGLYRCFYASGRNDPCVEVFNKRVIRNFLTGTRYYGELIVAEIHRPVAEYDVVWWDEPMNEPDPTIEELKGFYPNFNWEKTLDRPI